MRFWKRSVIVCATCTLGASLATSTGAEGRLAYLAEPDAYWQVWVVSADGSEVRQVTRSAYEKARASWFPDARHLLVNALDGRVFRVDSETGEEDEVEMPLVGANDAVISPDGTQIAFSLSTAGSVDDNEIWITGLDGSGARRLTNMPYLQHDPQWSRDGRWLYFLSGDGQQAHDIWRVAVNTGSTEQLTVGRLYHFELALGSDGELAFSSNRSGDYEIYTQAGINRPARRLTHAPGLDGGPTWSADGARIAFHSTRGGTLNLWVVDSAGENSPVQLTHHALGARNPVWAPEQGRAHE